MCDIRLPVFSLIQNKISILVLSQNRPELCSNAKWAQNATILGEKNEVGEQPRAVFINSNNIIFVIPKQSSVMKMWSEPIGWSEANLGGFSIDEYPPIFVTNNDEVYFQSSDLKNIYKWTKSAGNSQLAQHFSERCFRFFIDINNTLYCSAHFQNKVLSVSLSNIGSTSIIVAGTGSGGTSSNQLAEPSGIFVTNEFYLYVADSINNRIQNFRLGERNGTTVAGNGIPRGLKLDRPLDVALDSEGRMFIVESNGNRITQATSDNYRYIVGCASGGTSPNDLKAPGSIQFDSVGNLYVANTDVHLFQKFTLLTNSCGT